MIVVRQSVGDVCRVDSGPAFKSAQFVDPEEGVPLLRGDNIEPGRLRWAKTRAWPTELLNGYEHLYVETGDLILGMDRPVISTGLRVARVTAADCPSLLVQRVARIHPVDIDGTYLYHWLSGQGFIQHLQGTASGTQLPHVTLKSIRDYLVPRFGPSVERRIVEILEEHLSHIDAAHVEIQRAGVKLEALWASTMSGARAGSEVALPTVTDIQGGIQKQPKRAPVANHYPFLRVANVTATGLDLRDVHRMELFGDELERMRLLPGDLLVVEGNGSPTQIGRAAAWNGSIDNCVHQNHLIRVRPLPGLLPGYLEAVWNSPEHRRTLTDVSSSSSGLHTLSVSKLKRLSIPVPSLETQADLLSRVQEVRLALDRQRTAITGAIAKGRALRRAVLAAAFQGKLTGRHTDAEVIEELAEA